METTASKLDDQQLEGQMDAANYERRGPDLASNTSDTDDVVSSKSDGQDSDTDSDSDAEETDLLKQHASYNQVLLDVSRCAGRVERLKQIYYHKTEDFNSEFEPYRELQDLTSDIESPESSENNENSRKAHLNKSNADLRSCKSEMSSTFSLVMQDIQSQRRLCRKLTNLIVRILIRKPDLHYYQGFHDVCLSYMILYGCEGALEKLDQVVDSHFKIFMRPTMNETQQFLDLIPTIIGIQDARVQDFLEQTEVGTIFALSWTITWFSHVIPNESDVEKIFNFLGIEDPHMVLYLCAAIVLFKKDEFLGLEPEMSTIHHYLCQIPRKESLPIDRLIEDSKHTFKRYPPDYVKQKQESHRLWKLQVHNYKMIESLVGRIGSRLTNIISTHGQTALVVFAVSAIAIQLDRWYR